MDKDLPQRLIMGFLVLVMGGFLLFVLVVKPPWATSPPVPDNTTMDDRTPTLSSTAPEIMTVTPMPPSAVTITMTEEELTALVIEGLENAGEDATGGVTIYDPVFTINNVQIELDAVTPTLVGEVDLYLATVPVVENGELDFHVTAATVSGISLPDRVISQIEGELDQMLSQWLSGGSEIQAVTLSDGQISVVLLP